MRTTSTIPPEPTTRWAARQVWRGQAATSLDCRSDQTRRQAPGTVARSGANLEHLAVIGSARDSRGSVVEIDQVKASAGAQDIALATFEIDGPQDLAPAFDAFKGRTEAVYVVSNPFTTTNGIGRRHFGAWGPPADDVRLPGYRQSGSLISYGPDFLDLWRRAAELCQQDSARNEACRYSGGAADKIRSRCQSDDSESARTCHSGDGARRAPTR